MRKVHIFCVKLCSAYKREDIMADKQKFNGDFGSSVEIAISLNADHPETIRMISTEGADGNAPSLTPATALELGHALINLANQIEASRRHSKLN